MTCLSCVAILRESNGFSVVQRTRGKGKILKGRVEEEGFDLCSNHNILVV